MPKETNKRYRFSDDKMFCTVLARRPELAKKLIETILGIKIDHVECVNAQQILNYSTDARSVRFDVYLSDQKGVAFDLEMETSADALKLRVLPKRSRFYSSVIDSEKVPPGSSFEDIAETYVIFICLKDPFEPYGLARYTTRQVCLEDSSVPVDDGVRHIYLNCNAINENVSEEVRELLAYISGRAEPNSELTKELDQSVEKINNDKLWRRWAMTFEQQLIEYGADCKAQGFEEGNKKGVKTGEKKGIKKGIKKGKEEMIVAMLNDGLNAQTVARYAKGYSVQQIEQIRSQMSAVKIA